ncbi:hypothetical protein [Undibacterium sp. WLX3042]|uniref:hypothetical protein n=1 Tax=Undibacterium sp. WLX3042 TaxID=3412686 RepID=UPI003C2D2C2D
MIKKRNILILFVFFLTWLFTDLDYDAKNQDSVSRMLKWSPFSTNACLMDMNIAADNPRMTNLDGLNCPQIRDIALSKLQHITDKQIKLFNSALEEAKKSSASRLEIFFINSNDGEKSIFNENAVLARREIFEISEIQNFLDNAKQAQKVIEESSGFFRKIPWAKRPILSYEKYVPVKFNIVANNKDVKQATVEPSQQDAQKNFQEILKNSAEQNLHKWELIQSNPTSFLKNCVNEEIKLKEKNGIKQENQGKNEAEKICSEQLEILRNCMSKPSANATHCFAEVFETGD